MSRGERDPRRRRAPSWLGTVVVAIFVVMICLRTAAALRRAVAPGGAPSVSPSGPNVTSATSARSGPGDRDD